MNEISFKRRLIKIRQKQYQKKENNQKSQADEIQKKHNRNDVKELNMKVRKMNKKKVNYSKKYHVYQIYV